MSPIEHSPTTHPIPSRLPGHCWPTIRAAMGRHIARYDRAADRGRPDRDRIAAERRSVPRGIGALARKLVRDGQPEVGRARRPHSRNGARRRTTARPSRADAAEFKRLLAQADRALNDSALAEPAGVPAATIRAQLRELERSGEARTAGERHAADAGHRSAPRSPTPHPAPGQQGADPLSARPSSPPVGAPRPGARTGPVLRRRADRRTVALDLDDVRLSARKGVLRIYGKCERLREIRLHSALRNALVQWVAKRRGWGPAQATARRCFSTGAARG